MKTSFEEINDLEKVELLSEEVQEILGQPPKWILRRGMTVFLLVLIMIIAGSFVFNYPDVISSRVVIISNNPSISIVANSSGKVVKLFVQNEKDVKKNELLAIIENSANFEHVFEVKKMLDSLSNYLDTNLITKQFDFQSFYSLGDIQSAYSIFQRNYNDFFFYNKINFIQTEITSLMAQYSDYKLYLSKIQKQIINKKNSLDLVLNKYKRDSILYFSNVTSISEYEQSKQDYYNNKSVYEGLLATFSNITIQLNLLSYKINDLENKKREQDYIKINELKESFDILYSSINNWENKFVLISPIEGKIVFNRFWSENQFLNEGEKIFVVIPSLEQRIIGRAQVPILGSGKILKGQKVLVRLDNFPHQEFGMLEGRLESLSLAPENGENGIYYTAIISFPQKLITNYKHSIPFQQELFGDAEIITQNHSLFERLINPLKSSYRK